MMPMSAIGTKRTSLVALHMSAFGGKADIVGHRYELRLRYVELEKPPACDRGLSSLPSQHSCRGVLSLDDEQRSNTQRECCPRHNQDVCHGTSPAVTRLETNATPQPTRHKKNPRKPGSSVSDLGQLILRRTVEPFRLPKGSARPQTARTRSTRPSTRT